MTTAANLSQSKFRGRSDAGAVDGTPTWIAAINTNWSQAVGTNFRVRFLIQNTTSGTPTAGQTVKIQCNKNGGTFQDVTTSSTIVKAVNAGSDADETTIATAVLAGTGTYAAGRYDETGGVSTGVTVAASGNTEYEFGVQINNADVSNNDTIIIKVVTVTGSTITATTSPSITVIGKQTLTPSLFSNTQTFSAPTVTQPSSATMMGEQLIVYPSELDKPTLFTRRGVAPGQLQTLTPSLFSNTQTFYSATVSIVLKPGAQASVRPREDVSPILRTSRASSTASSQTLTPSLFSNTQTFYSATVTAGAVTLTPSLFSNTQTFYTPTVTTGSVTVTPSLFSNTQTFYNATVSQPGTTTMLGAQLAIWPPDELDTVPMMLTPGILDAPTPAGSQTLTPDLFSNTQTFYSATITQTIPDFNRGPVVVTINSDGEPITRLFFRQGAKSTLTQSLSPSLFQNTQTFYSATVTQTAIVNRPAQVVVKPSDEVQPTLYSKRSNTNFAQTLTPSLFSNLQTFSSATVTQTTVASRPAQVRIPPSNEVQPILYARRSPTIWGQTLAPSLFTNTQTFYNPTVSFGTQYLLPSLFTNQQQFFQHTLTGGDHPETAQNTGGGFFAGRTRRPVEDIRRSNLRKAYVVIRKNAKKLSAELRDEILDVILFEGPSLPPVSKLDLEATVRDVDLKRAEEVFARAIVQAELPEPELEPINEYAPLVELEQDATPIKLDLAPDGSWSIGLPAAIAEARRNYELMLQDEEDLILLLT